VMAVAQLRTAKRAADDARRQATRAANAAARRAAASYRGCRWCPPRRACSQGHPPLTRSPAWSSAARPSMGPAMGPTIYVRSELLGPRRRLTFGALHSRRVRLMLISS